MTKDKVVVFTTNNARVLVNYKLPKRLNPRGHFVIDPDLSLVKNTPPHFWKLDGGIIKELTPREKIFRLRDIKWRGADNDWRKVLYSPKKNYWHYLKIPLIMSLGAAITLILSKITHG